jgi:cytochrome c oxidase subunit 1
MVTGLVLYFATWGGSFWALSRVMGPEPAMALAYLLGLTAFLAGVGAFAALGRYMTGTPEPKQAGIRRYFSFNTDHKVVGVQYLFAVMTVFLLAGVMAMLMRLELAKPGAQFPTLFAAYPTLMGVHGIGMTVTALTIIIGALGNYFVPLMIGAEDMAFPRMNAVSFWLVPPAVVILLSSLFAGGFDFGWTAYAPLSTRGPLGKLFFLLAFVTIGFSSILGAVNFLATVRSLRAKGMTFFKIPIFVHSMVAAATIAVIATSVVAASLIMVIFDRTLGTSFFNPDQGGNVLLYQHLFWYYSHPAVYVMILPGFGLMLELLPVYARKPLFAYPLVAVSFPVIVFLSCIVWAHHQFTSGMWGLLNFPFMITTELISVPTGVVFLSAVGTVWRGKLRLATPMLFALAVVFNFLIGGLTGVFLADVPTDLHLHDTLFVTAHFHFTIVGGVIFAFFGGMYHWFPKMTGRMYNEKMGKWHFWLFFIGFYATFIPMFWTGTQGIRRRVADFPVEGALPPLQMWISWASCLILAGVAVFLYNMIRSLRSGPTSSPNPWDAQTLEWTLPSPPPAHNFSVPPVVTRLPYDFGRPV